MVTLHRNLCKKCLILKVEMFVFNVFVSVLLYVNFWWRVISLDKNKCLCLKYVCDCFTVYIKKFKEMFMSKYICDCFKEMFMCEQFMTVLLQIHFWWRFVIVIVCYNCSSDYM